jgi:hypothetical protein
MFLLTLMFLPVAAGAQTGFSVQSDGDGQLYSINLQTGTAIPIGPTGFEDIECLTFNLSGDTLYGVNDFDEGSGELVTCNPNTGACSLVGNLGVGGGQCGLAFDCNGDLFMSQNFGPEGGTFYSINPDTGVATSIGDQGQGVTGLTARLDDNTCPSGVFGLGVNIPSPVAELGCMNTVTGAFQEIGPLVTVDLFCGGIDFDSNDTLWGINDGEEGEPEIFTINPDTGLATVIIPFLKALKDLQLLRQYVE